MSGISQKLKQKIEKAVSKACAESVIFAFPFDLDKETDERRDGVFAASKKEAFVICDGKLIQKLELSEVCEFVTDMGVGCVFLSFRDKKGETFLICRSDLKYSKEMIAAVRRINSYIEDGNIPKSFEGASDRCSKCGRPLRRGSTVCFHCTDKMQVLKRTWGLFSPYKLYVFLAAVLFFAVSGLRLLLPYLNRLAVDDYIRASNPESVNIVSFVIIILSIGLIEAAGSMLSAFRGHFLIGASNRMIVDLRGRLFDKIERLSISKISQRTAGDLMRRVTSDTSTIDNFLVNYLPSTLEQLVLFAAVAVYMLIYDYKLCLLVLLPTPFVVLSFNFFWRYMRGLFHKRWQAGSKTNSILHDIFSGIRVVKAFGMEHRENMRFEAATAEEKRMQIKTDCIWSILMPILRFFICFGEFIILFYVGNQILGGRMTLGEMTQFSSYASMVYGPLRMIAHIPRHVMHFTTSASKIFEILDEDTDVSDAENPCEVDIKGSIELKNVSFGYDSGKEVLHKINISINPGDFIGIVGASGVGKSTLINLIMRMYDVDDGSILVDGVDIRDISQNSLRSQMGVVLQETFLFSGSVYQNIAYARPDATREQVIAVSKLAGCHDFIMRMPDGYNSRVGEKGSTLSGGERQRIAIARALLHDPKILILDEATASLDTETEKQIQDALARLASKRTTIAIAHRLSTLRNATRLVVLDKGRVAEEGSHQQLMAKKGIYYSLVMAQREMTDMSNA